MTNTKPHIWLGLPVADNLHPGSYGYVRYAFEDNTFGMRWQVHDERRQNRYSNAETSTMIIQASDNLPAASTWMQSLSLNEQQLISNLDQQGKALSKTKKGRPIQAQSFRNSLPQHRHGTITSRHHRTISSPRKSTATSTAPQNGRPMETTRTSLNGHTSNPKQAKDKNSSPETNQPKPQAETVNSEHSSASSGIHDPKDFSSSSDSSETKEEEQSENESSSVSSEEDIEPSSESSEDDSVSVWSLNPKHEVPEDAEVPDDDHDLDPTITSKEASNKRKARKNKHKSPENSPKRTHPRHNTPTSSPANSNTSSPANSNTSTNHSDDETLDDVQPSEQEPFNDDVQVEAQDTEENPVAPEAQIEAQVDEDPPVAPEVQLEAQQDEENPVEPPQQNHTARYEPTKIQTKLFDELRPENHVRKFLKKSNRNFLHRVVSYAYDVEIPELGDPKTACVFDEWSVDNTIIASALFLHGKHLTLEQIKTKGLSLEDGKDLFTIVPTAYNYKDIFRHPELWDDSESENLYRWHIIELKAKPAKGDSVPPLESKALFHPYSRTLIGCSNNHARGTKPDTELRPKVVRLGENKREEKDQDSNVCKHILPEKNGRAATWYYEPSATVSVFVPNPKNLRL